MGRNILVLGAGFGGLSTVRELQKHVAPDDKITLIDRSDTQVQGLSLLWLLRGWRTLDQVQVVPTKEALGRAEHIVADIEQLDLAARQVRTPQGDFAYDALVLALGAELHTGAVPGLDEALSAGVAAHYYTPEAAVDAHAKLKAVSSGKVVFLVARIPYKCPAAPYEGVMLASDLLTETGVRDNVSVDVYTPESQPMPVAGPVVGQGVVQMLESQKIGFHPGRQVERVDAVAREVVFADGERVSFDLLVFIPPHQPPAPIKAAELSPTGWVPVDANTLKTIVDGVWALGDVVSITLTNGKPLPKAAVFAKGQAEAVAAGVARHLGHEQAPEPYFNGEGYCFLEIGGHLAAKGAGNFYHPDGPEIELSEPSEELHRAKEREEQQWLAEWSTGQHDG
ncbi:NAD(P)/FAD-dependent oxidoreductase [Streptomyces chiangmaiensis]|uniref:FAD/NAD(P)-binding oxidoreductase n=1 Tax=Streptomyces chiangmaiensis TaxID=766497 RepID=A0ABU7FM86_9ACTN|nr:FAD/NAD(P)-binding oxidoreductase [Streptomyces chiangmaiensis]MED7825055.1 FAD/NAD(P)-binding oxidoreductase [Streptomyces chiangmaiensis]